MSITRRQIFENLTLARSREVADLLAIEDLARLNKQALIDKLSRKSSLPPELVLNELKRDELKKLCEDLSLDSSGREKQQLINRLLGKEQGVSEQAARYITNTNEPSVKTAKRKNNGEAKDKSLESWIWDAACSIRGAKDAPKYKDFILPLIFTKRLCDVFDDELNRIAKEVGSRKKAFQLVKADHKLVRFYLPLMPDDPEQPVWSVIRKLSDHIGQELTGHLREIAKANPRLQGILDRIDFNATTHGQRDLDEDRLSNLIEAISTKRLGLEDVEPDIIGKSYEYLIRKFA